MPQKYAFFLHLNATRAWLSLSREGRRKFFHRIQEDIFKKYPGISYRLFDVEAFNAHCSDIILFEANDVQQYYYLMEELRDSAIYTVPYFEIVGIYPAIEDGFSNFESDKQ